MKTVKDKQRGISLFGMLVVAAGLIFIVVLGMKVVPPYIHSMQIAQIFKTIASDPAMQGVSVKEIKDSYAKRANVNYITDLSADDIDISTDNGRLILSTSYTVKIPLVANITLLLEFNPSSS